MVAYSFNRQFADPIRARTKRQTLRNDRKRHARPGETLQLYTGMRTRQCRLIGTATCIGTNPVRLDFEQSRVEYLDTGQALTMEDQLHAFAQVDGFADWRALVAFWSAEHAEAYKAGAWQGIRIAWFETFVPAVERDGKMVPA